MHNDFADGILFQRNRDERQVARKDVPLAKICQTEEEERLQREAMMRLESNKQRSVHSVDGRL